jgi:hypothetical protein
MVRLWAAGWATAGPGGYRCGVAGHGGQVNCLHAFTYKKGNIALDNLSLCQAIAYDIGRSRKTWQSVNENQYQLIRACTLLTIDSAR